MKNYYSDKTILITGASSGIGLEFANQLNEFGANLILTARSKAKLNELAENYQSAIVIPGDLSDNTFPSQLYNEIQSKGIEVDILINNAGFGSIGKLLRSDSVIYESMVQVNITSLTQLSHLFITDMAEKGKGGIINVASVAAFQPVPYMNVYSATKAYVRSFSLALHEEYKDRGIVITAVCPGYTKTNFQNAAKMSPNAVGIKMLPDDVVRQSLIAHKKGKNLVINGLINKIMAHSNRFLPSAITLAVTRNLMKKA
ncbi:MAG: SDR family oxidoreductase [Candidatus Marinimicrobia bacterium]|nr:SDR family oxidoreductase [Candidatus Neomarinimicrobiota bacterium]